MKTALIINGAKDRELENTRRIVGFLKDKTELCTDDEHIAASLGIKYAVSAELLSGADVAVALGGDGTILQRAAECAENGVKVLGINLGKIGFMAEIEPSDTECALEKLLSGDYGTEKRMMIKAVIRKSDGSEKSFHALNDVVVSKSLGDQLIAVELFADGERVNRYSADGLIIATPTGSTGYSISAGGPVVEPGMRLLVATPICAHTLSARSAVLPSCKTIKIKINSFYGGSEAFVTADGGIRCGITDNDEVIITESEYDFELIKIGNQSFYDTLISKLS